MILIIYRESYLSARQREAKEMKKQRVLLRVKEYTPKETRFDDTSILLLKPVKEDWIEESINIKEGEDVHDKLHELLDKKLEEIVRGRKDIFVEIEASMPGLTVKVGGGEYTGRIIALSPRPTKLLKIGVILEEEKQEKSEDSQGDNRSNVSQGFVLPVDKAKWYNVDDDLYLFEGFVLSKKPWKAIIFVTEHGERVLLPGDFETKTIVLGEQAERRASKPKTKSAKSKTKRKRRKRKTKKKRKSRKKKG